MGQKNRKAGKTAGFPIESLKLVVAQGRRAEAAEHALPPELQRQTRTNKEDQR